MINPWNHDCKKVTLKISQCTLKENLLLQKDLLELYRIKAINIWLQYQKYVYWWVKWDSR